MEPPTKLNTGSQQSNNKQSLVQITKYLNDRGITTKIVSTIKNKYLEVQYIKKDNPNKVKPNVSQTS
jgi:hypothetical protein